MDKGGDKLKALIGLGLALLLAPILRAQVAGTVVVTSVVTATVGTGTGQVICILSNQASPTIHTVCTVGGVTVLTMDSTPAVGALIGANGTYSQLGNAVTWMIEQPTIGNITWQIAANGTVKNGTF
jgi:H+/Cl- antiporter ClcA